VANSLDQPFTHAGSMLACEAKEIKLLRALLLYCQCALNLKRGIAIHVHPMHAGST
jgi:hypothetical protein